MAQQDQSSPSSLLNRDHREPSDSSDLSDNSDGSSLKLELRKTKLSTITMNDDCMKHIQKQCERFDRYCKFLDSAQSGLPSASAVKGTVAEIDEIMMNAERAIQEKMATLRKDIFQFQNDVSEHADPYWYRNIADLTGYDASRFTEILRTMRIRDYQDFAEYLKETLPKASDKTRPYHEYGETTFLAKVHMLLDRVVRYAEPPVSFDLFAFVKAKVFIVCRNRVPSRTLDKEVEFVDTQLHQLMSAHSELPNQEDYWDFPATWRLLVTAWEYMPAEPRSLLQLLGAIRGKAEAEIRYRTNIAVNRKLPQELSDLILEQTMTLEEVPFDPET